MKGKWSTGEQIAEFVPEAFEYGLEDPGCLRRNGYELFTVGGDPYAKNSPIPDGNLSARRLV